MAIRPYKSGFHRISDLCFDKYACADLVWFDLD